MGTRDWSDLIGRLPLNTVTEEKSKKRSHAITSRNNLLTVSLLERGEVMEGVPVSPRQVLNATASTEPTGQTER